MINRTDEQSIGRREEVSDGYTVSRKDERKDSWTDGRREEVKTGCKDERMEVLSNIMTVNNRMVGRTNKGNCGWDRRMGVPTGGPQKGARTE